MKDIVKFRFAGIGIVVAMCAVFGAGVMLLWNALMPQVFGLPQVGYLQAVGLLVLARLLFGGIDHRHPAHPGHREMHHGNMLRERWAGMSEEERAAVAKRGMTGFGPWDPRFSMMRDLFEGERARQRPDAGGEKGGGDE